MNKQKKINHVFHYTSAFKHLQDTVRSGFQPSYCMEKVGNSKYMIPMVSFCNIPIVEVDKYMHYGKNGIGMSLNWAVENGLTPVTYVHRKSPYHSILGLLEWIKLNTKSKDESYFDSEGNLKKHFSTIYNNNLLSHNIIVKNLQLLKNWDVFHKGVNINTYQEREWRYIPDSNNIKDIIYENDLEYKDFQGENKKRKPHLPEQSLIINKIDDIRYIVVSTDPHVKKIIGTLNKRFTKDVTTKAILSGKLSILTESQIRNDF